MDLRLARQNLSNEIFSWFAIFPLYLYHGRLRNDRLSLYDIITLYFFHFDPQEKRLPTMKSKQGCKTNIDGQTAGRERLH